MELTDAAKREAALVVRAERAEACLREALVVLDGIGGDFAADGHAGYEARVTAKMIRALLAQIEGER